MNLIGSAYAADVRVNGIWLALSEKMARVKYLNWPIEEPNAVLVKTSDVEALKGLPNGD